MEIEELNSYLELGWKELDKNSYCCKSPVLMTTFSWGETVEICIKCGGWNICLHDFQDKPSGTKCTICSKVRP